MARKKNYKHGVKRATIYSILAVLLIAIIVPSGVVLVDAWNEKIKSGDSVVWFVQNPGNIESEFTSVYWNGIFKYRHYNASDSAEFTNQDLYFPNATGDSYVMFVVNTATHTDESSTIQNYMSHMNFNYTAKDMMDNSVSKFKVYFSLMGNYTVRLEAASGTNNNNPENVKTIYDGNMKIVNTNESIIFDLNKIDIIAADNYRSTYNILNFIITPVSEDFDILPNDEINFQFEFIGPSGTGVISRFGGMDSVYGIFGGLLIVMSIFCTPFVNPTKRDKFTLTPWAKKSRGSYRTSSRKSYRRPRTKSYKKRRSRSYRSRRY